MKISICNLCPINNAGRPGLNRLYTKYYRLTTNWPSTTVENALQIDPFMQNKANFQKSQMNVSPYNTTDYENKSNWTLGENKPNTNPIQTQSNPIKANIMPKQTQYKAKQSQFQRQKNAALHLFAVGYLRKKLYPVTLLIGNLRLISHLIAKEKVR